LTTYTTTGTDGAPRVVVVTPTPTTVTYTKPQTYATTFTTTGIDNGQATVEVDLPCRTPGLRAAFYNNPYRRSDINTAYTNFDPSYFPPLGSSSSLLAFVRYNGDISFQVASNQQVPVYGVSVALDYRTIQVETYIYSPVAQTLRFLAYADDINFGYVGQKAYSGPFTKANADAFEVAGNTGTPGSARDGGAVFTVAAGSFTPLRIINGFDLYTYGANGPYHTAIHRIQINNTATNTAASYTLYSDVCAGDAANFPNNAM